MKPDAGFVPPKKPSASALPADNDEGFIQKPAPKAEAGPVKPDAAAPEEEKLGKPGDTISNKPTAKSAPTDSIKKDDLDAEKRTDVNVQPLNLGDKIVWDSEPIRSNRREIRLHVANARLMRIPAFPSTDWIPMTDPATSARK